MFQKGNRLGKGRPKVSLKKPELLLPLVFSNSCINWANDFCMLYKKMKKEELTLAEKAHLKFLMELMPYLCTKVQLKEIEDKLPRTPTQSSAYAKDAMDLIKQLEGDSGPSTEK